jgi:hypothetical protein
VTEQFVLIYTNYYIYTNFYLCLYYDKYTHKQTKQYFIELYRSITNTHLFTLTTTTSMLHQTYRAVHGNELHTKNRRNLVKQLDPHRGTNLRRPESWYGSSDAELLELVDVYEITRLKFRKLYRKTHPEGLPTRDSDSDEPISSLPSIPSTVSQEGKNTLEIEVRVERGENCDEPGGAVDPPLVPIEGTNIDNCINVCESDEDEGEGDQTFDPFANAHPFDTRRICRDLTLEPSWYPNIAQVRIKQSFPTGSAAHPLNPTWHPLAQQWGPPPAVVPPFYPYSQLLHRCCRSRFPKCGFYHIIWNAIYDLSARWVDLPCGCLDIEEHNPWLGPEWIKTFFPVLYARLLALQQHHLNNMDLPFFPDCFVVQIPDDYTAAASKRVEIWPIRSRFKIPVNEPVTTPKRRRSGQPHSSKKQLANGRKRRAKEAVNYMNRTLVRS